MHKLFTKLLQTIEKQPFASMRASFGPQGWKPCFVSKNIKFLGCDAELLMSGKTNWLDMIHPDDIAGFRHAAKELASGKGEAVLNYRLVAPDGTENGITNYLRSVRGGEAEPAYIDSVIFWDADGNAQPVRERAYWKAALNDIVFAIKENDGYSPLEIILKKTGEYLGTSRILLMAQPDARTKCQVLHAWTKNCMDADLNTEYGTLCGNGNKNIKNTVKNTGIYVVNTEDIPSELAAGMHEHGLLSIVIVSVQIYGPAKGCLRFEELESPRSWSEAELEFVKDISDLVSATLLHGHGLTHKLFPQNTCEAVLNNVNSFIFVTDQETDKIIFANLAFRNLFGDGCIGNKCGEYLDLGLNRETDSYDGKFRSGQTYETYLERTGQWLAVTRDLVPWVNGTPVYLNSCYDITFKKNYEDSIKRIAFLDHLTSLPNRYRCDTDLRLIMNQVKRGDRTGHLLFIDLDDFKVVNDTHGHHYGDAVLVSFATFLQERYGRDNYVYRFGGDEFVLIIMDCDDNEINRHLEALLERAQKPWRALNREFYCSLSIGAVKITAGNTDSKKILQQADIAMYQAKQNSKNNYVFYTEGLNSATIERSEMEWLLREAMENDFQGFEIYYQPYKHTKNLKIIGAEALVRMRDQNGELLLPSTFVPLAEYLGFIVPLGEHILRTAATQCKAVNDSGLPNFSMTVNLSARQFQQKDIVERLLEILNSTGVDLSNMVIAVSETVAIKELNHMLKLCGKLREYGIRVALDNFGSGTSSFINMRDLPVDIIKVSSSHIDAYKDKYSGYFIRLVNDISHFSGKVVCVNGVENKEHYQFCKELGIDMVQGFLFHRPDTLEVLQSLLNWRMAG